MELAGLLVRGVLVLDALVLLAVAGYAVERRADRPEALPFGATAGTVALAALAVAGFGEIGGTRSLSWTVMASLFLVFVTAWTWFVAAYTGEVGSVLERPLRLLAPVPAVGVLTVGLLHVTGNPVPTMPRMTGSLYVLLFTLPTFVVIGIFFGSILLVLRAAFGYASTRPLRVTGLAVGALGGGILPVVLSLPYSGPGLLQTEGYAVAYTVTAGTFAGAVRGRTLFQAGPLVEAIGRDTLVTEIEDLVIVVDLDGRIADLNPAAEAALAVDLESVAGDLLRRHLEFEGPIRDLEDVEIRQADGRHHYEAALSEVSEAGRRVGHALVLRDVTARRTRRQRLEVLNRVLRHNLRNDMTTVMGYADVLSEEIDRQEPIDRIHRTADALADLGDKAREIEQIMAASTDRDQATDAVRIAQFVAEEARQVFPGAQIDVDLGPPVEVAASEGVVWPILWNLVENAVEHHDGDTPHVEIAVERRDAPDVRGVLVVRDDGPGIPSNDRRAIETGEESPLSHGSGLGLWAVKWGTTRVGGAVDIATREGGGTAVTVALPLASAGPGGAGDRPPVADAAPDPGAGQESTGADAEDPE